MVILFVLTIFIIFNKFHKQKKFLIFCIIFSPTSLLAIERGNFDLLLFLLAILEHTPIIFSDSKLSLSKGVPLLGEHNNEILAEIKKK